jgi:hypothetical protein
MSGLEQVVEAAILQGLNEKKRGAVLRIEEPRLWARSGA